MPNVCFCDFKVDRRPIFSHCPNSTVIPTDVGQSYATFVWDVPTATDRSGKNVSVVIWPSVYNSPVRLAIGLHAIEVTATSDGERRFCSFNVTVQGLLLGDVLNYSLHYFEILNIKQFIKVYNIYSRCKK